jgi:hypothetical protein
MALRAAFWYQMLRRLTSVDLGVGGQVGSQFTVRERGGAGAVLGTGTVEDSNERVHVEYLPGTPESEEIKGADS